jgi:hypothetical protein
MLWLSRMGAPLIGGRREERRGERWEEHWNERDINFGHVEYRWL